MNFPLLRTAEDFQNGKPPPSIEEAQQKIIWADHLLILFPLWLGAMPAVLKAFFDSRRCVQGLLLPQRRRAACRKSYSAAGTSLIVVMYGYAWSLLSFLLAGAQPEEPGEERSRVLRHQACRFERNWNDRSHEREAAGETGSRVWLRSVEKQGSRGERELEVDVRCVGTLTFGAFAGP